MSGYFYVASPYSKYPAGLEAAHRDICKVMGELVRAGIPAFSPIGHTHPIAMTAMIDPFDHSIWLPFDEPMMTAAMGLIVVKMEGWEESYGVRQEMTLFASAKKPILFLDPTTLLLGERPLSSYVPRAA